MLVTYPSENSQSRSNSNEVQKSRLPEVLTFGIFLLAGLCLTLWTFNPVRLERERLAAQIEFFTALQEQGFRMEVK
jgi:hypothetical protein